MIRILLAFLDIYMNIPVGAAGVRGMGGRGYLAYAGVGRGCAGYQLKADKSPDDKLFDLLPGMELTPLNTVALKPPGMKHAPQVHPRTHTHTHTRQDRHTQKDTHTQSYTQRPMHRWKHTHTHGKTDTRTNTRKHTCTDTHRHKHKSGQDPGSSPITGTQPVCRLLHRQ